jgi:hypothetical protein
MGVKMGIRFGKREKEQGIRGMGSMALQPKEWNAEGADAPDLRG